ncbi:MAG: HD-GYP domain-containing protein [Candidatus Omnitrophica bacterium]|nr:HD-GYP domain-containing protein [Candidatus Omnitrophota bacterium]
MTAQVAWMCFGLSLAALGAAGVFLFSLSRRLKNRSQELEELKIQFLEWSRRLEEKVTDRTLTLETIHSRLEETYLETVTALVETVAARDSYLSEHSHNVASYARVIAQELGFSEERIHHLIHGCRLHDLGKIAIPDAILLKPGPLTPEEFEIIKQHPTWGAKILEPLTFMRDVTEMVHQEHERWDGAGYPRGLRGEQIRLEARIIAVADTIDAMTSDRPYRKRVSLETACAELERCSGTQFDPMVVDACLKAVSEEKLSTEPEAHHDQILEKAYRRVSRFKL